MKALRNEPEIGAVIAASARDAPRTEMMPLFVARNVYLVGPDVPIYRIVARDHLLEDIAQGVFTHTRIGEKSWVDPLENPLLERQFKDPLTGGPISLKPLVEDTFGSCWSLTPLDSPGDWATFSHGLASVRIASTPRALLAAVMSAANPYSDLQHAVGQIQYVSEAEIEDYFGDPDFSKHFDSLGHGIHLSLMALQTDLKDENEVRLVCDLFTNDSWQQQNIKLVEPFLKVPCNWQNVVRSLVAGPFVRAGGEKDIQQKLHALGIVCPVSSSPTRPYTG
jgi:hypothetical protein